MFSHDDLRRYDEPEFVVGAFELPRIADLPCTYAVRIVVQLSRWPESIVTIQEDHPHYRIQIVTSRESVWGSIPKRISRPNEQGTYKALGHFTPTSTESTDLSITIDEFRKEYPHLDGLFQISELRDDRRGGALDGAGARLTRKRGDCIETAKLSNPEGRNAEVIREARDLIENYTHYYSQVEHKWEAEREGTIQQWKHQEAMERTRRLEEAKRHNAACLRFAEQGPICPHCRENRQIRFIEESPPAHSYFICKACGRSFDAVD